MSNASIQQLIASAKDSIRAGKIQDAITSYTEIVALEPASSTAWLTLGQLQADCGLIDAGLSSIERSISLDSGLSEAWLSLAYLQHATENLEDAKRSALRAVDVEYELVEAWLFLSGIAGQLGEYEEAENCAWRALTLDSDNPDACVNYGNALSHIGNTAEAEENYRAALKIQPDNPQAYLCLTSLLLTQTRHSEASQFIQSAQSLKLNVDETLCELGFVFLEKGNAPAAITLFENVVNARPMLPHAHLGLGKAYLIERRIEEAISSLMQALELSPDLLEAQQLLDSANS